MAMRQPNPGNEEPTAETMPNNESTSGTTSSRPAETPRMTGGTRPARSESGARSQGVGQQAQRIGHEAQNQASQLVGKAQQQVARQLGGQLDVAAGGLGSVAEAIESVGRQLRENDQQVLATYAGKAADQIQQLSGFLRDKDVSELVDDVEHFARRRPELFLGGAFALGLIAARFLRSSGSRRESMEPRGGYRPVPTSFGQGTAESASGYGSQQRTGQAWRAGHGEA